MRKNNKKIIIILVGVIAIIGIFVIWGFKESDRIIARYTTYEHYRYSPIVLDNNIYFPSSFSDKDIKEPKTIGLLGAKDKGWFVDCFASTGAVIVDDNDKEKNKIKVIDDFPMTYIKGQSNQKIHERTFDKPIVYIGTIFMKNNKLYYGNFSNEIKDQLYDDFMDKYANLIQGENL